jgi:hypothetical protein
VPNPDVNPEAVILNVPDERNPGETADPERYRWPAHLVAPEDAA